MGLSNREEIAESEHFKAVVYTSLGLNGWLLEIKRKGDEGGDLYFTRRDKDEIVEFLGSIPSMIKKTIEDYVCSCGQKADIVNGMPAPNAEPTTPGNGGRTGDPAGVAATPGGGRETVALKHSDGKAGAPKQPELTDLPPGKDPLDQRKNGGDKEHAVYFDDDGYQHGHPEDD